MSIRSIVSAASIIVLASSMTACGAATESEDLEGDENAEVEEVDTVEEGVSGCFSSFNWTYRYAAGWCYASKGYKSYRVWVWCDNETSYAGPWREGGSGSTVFCPGSTRPQASWMQVLY